MATQLDRSARVPSSGEEQIANRFGRAREYDEYRVKLYKVACRTAREQREQLRLDWEARNRDEE